MTFAEEDDDDSMIIPPKKFACALSNQPTSDPVRIASGLQNVERRYIQAECRKEVHTGMLLPSDYLIPDEELRAARFKRWNDINIINQERREYFRMLIRKIAHPGQDQLASAIELRMLVNDIPAFANVFYEIGKHAVLELARPLLSCEYGRREGLLTNVLVTLDLLVQHKNEICSLFAHLPALFDLFCESIGSGCVDTSRSALSLIYCIANFPDGREQLRRRGVVKHLVKLMDAGKYWLLNDILRALCQFDERSSEMVINGILNALFNHLDDEDLVRELPPLLTAIKNDKVVWEHVIESDMLYNKLFDILKDYKHHSDAAKCFSVEFLSTIIQSNYRAFLATRKCEEEDKIITRLVKWGNPRAKEIAAKILTYLGAPKHVHTTAPTQSDDLHSPGT